MDARKEALDAKKAERMDKLMSTLETTMPKCKKCGKVLLRCKCDDSTLEK